MRELGHEVRTLGTRTDETHLAAQDVPELRNLVDANLAYDATDARRAVVAFAGPHRTVCFSVSSHRTKLDQRERPPVLAHAILLVKDWTTGVELDQNRGHDHDRQRQERPQQRRRAVDHSA